MRRDKALKALLFKDGKGEIPLVKTTSTDQDVVKLPLLLDMQPNTLSDHQLTLLALFAGWLKHLPGSAVFKTPRPRKRAGALIFLMEGRNMPPDDHAAEPTLVGYLRTHLVSIRKTRTEWIGTYESRSDTARTLPELLSAMYCFLLLGEGHWVCLQDMRPREVLQVMPRGKGLTPTYTLSERDEPAMVRHILLAAPDNDGLRELLREYRLQWTAPCA